MTSRKILPDEVLSGRWIDEAECFRFLRDRRWPNGNFRCVRCGHRRAYERLSRLALQCASCASISGVRVGTTMAGSHLPLGTWLSAAEALVTGRPRAVGLRNALAEVASARPSHGGVSAVIRRLRDRMGAYVPKKLSGAVAVDLATIYRKADRVAIAAEIGRGRSGCLHLGIVRRVSDLKGFLRTTLQRPYPQIVKGPGLKTLPEVAYAGTGPRRRPSVRDRDRAPEVMEVDREISRLASNRVTVADRLDDLVFRWNHRGCVDDGIAFLLGLGPT